MAAAGSSSSSDPSLAKPDFSSGGGGAENSEPGAATVARPEQDMYRAVLKKAKKDGSSSRGSTAKERISKMPPCAAGKRSSIYRGVTRHRWTGRYEAHLWDKSTWNQNQNKKGKQVYLGAYDDEEAAARAYDLAALKYWGPGTLINFPVTDYSRDLEEMQNLSREDYLASLRRKSSGFSRGISKYRGLSSRWGSSFGHTAGAESFNYFHYGDDAIKESEYVRGLCTEMKIDLSSYIKWWGPNKNRQKESRGRSSEETKHGSSEDISCEMKALEWETQANEPYKMPRLGVSPERKQHKGSSVSALSILSRSAAFKSLQEKASKMKEMNMENDENENKNNLIKMDYGKSVEQSSSLDEASERFGVASGMGSDGLPLQRNVYPLTPFLSAPLLTGYNTVDPLADPILWTSLVPVLPSGPTCPIEVTKTESSSDYTFFQAKE